MTGLKFCSECGHVNDDNPTSSMCRTCEDWYVETVIGRVISLRTRVILLLLVTAAVLALYYLPGATLDG